MTKPDVYVMPIEPGAALPAGAQPAVSGPQFIIRDGADYWMPVAMIHYDASDASGLAEVRARMEAAINSGDVVIAVRSPDGGEAAMMSDNSTRP